MLELKAIVKQCKNQDAISSANKHIQAAIMVIKASNLPSHTNVLVARRKVYPDKNSEHQQKFFSTKKNEQHLWQ